MNIDDFRSHHIHTQLENLANTLAELDVTAIENVEKSPDLSKKLSYLAWCLEKSDPELLSIAVLDGLVGRLRNVESGIKSILSSLAQENTPQRRNAIKNSLESVRSNLEGCLVDLPYPRIQQIFRSEANSAIDQVVAASDEAVAGIERNLEESSRELNDQVYEISRILEEQKKEIEAQKLKRQELEKALLALEAKVTKEADAKAAVFDGLIEERRNELSTWQSNVEQEGEEYLTKIRNFYRMSGDSTLAGRFIEASREERAAYYALTLLSLCFFGGAIFTLLFGSTVVERLFSVVIDGPLVGWLTRVSLIIVFFVPATILSAQAGKHRRASSWYRTLGVRVATLKPYLAEFGDEKADYTEELKGILKAFFMSELKSENGKSAPSYDKGLIDLVTDQVKKLMPK